MIQNTANKPVIYYAIALYICLFHASAQATPTTLSIWQNIYSSSNSGNIAGCQLCHQNSSGGNGWNAYGWQIRQNLPGVFNAINAVASSDSNGNGSSNLEDIQNNQQPGWRNSASNTIRCDTTSSFNPCGDGNTQLSNQDSPNFSSLIPDTISIGESVALETIATGFSAPNLAIPAPSINGFLFVVDQPGIVWKVDLENGNKSKFLDDSQSVLNSGERGLLGLAFHQRRKWHRSWRR